jgi:glycosyltransferase involved in cell wall biosynthesis
MLQIHLLSPYHGGSHKAWAAGWQKNSQHSLTLHTLPDRFWKWRMHGGAITLARRFLASGTTPDLIVATDMLDLSTFLALTRRQTAALPTLLYMHENQLTYPLPKDGRIGPMRRQLGERDRHYAFINFTSMLAADHVLFNSQYHLDSFFAALPNFLKHFPEYNELGTIKTVKSKSTVLPVGVDFQRLLPKNQPVAKNQPPLILWNQRWEYDKNPEAFFAALQAMVEKGLSFRVALCGQQYGKRPFIFDEAITQLGDRVIHVGHADLPTYRQLLWEAAVTISTAHHEFFGISMLEAIYCQTFPLLPRRLSYPDLLPQQFHQATLYDSQSALEEKLVWALTHEAERSELAQKMATAVSHYAWQKVAPTYDEKVHTIWQNQANSK